MPFVLPAAPVVLPLAPTMLPVVESVLPKPVMDDVSPSGGTGMTFSVSGLGLRLSSPWLLMTGGDGAGRGGGMGAGVGGGAAEQVQGRGQ